MIVFDANASPFLVLWYFYLAFLGAVIVANIVAFLLRTVIERRTNRLLTMPRRKARR